MQVSEVGLGAEWPVEGLDIGGQLDEIAGDKTGSQAQVPQDLYQ